MSDRPKIKSFPIIEVRCNNPSCRGRRRVNTHGWVEKCSVCKDKRKPLFFYAQRDERQTIG